MEYDLFRSCSCKCHPVKEVCRACCVRTADQKTLLVVMEQNAREAKLQAEVDRLKVEKAESTAVTTALLAGCKAALGAFENHNAFDWSDLSRAIARAEGKPAEKPAGAETAPLVDAETPRDPNMYNGKPKDQDACLRELGWAILYMKYLHPDWLEHPNCKEQQRRVKILFKQVAVSWHRDEPWWWVQMFDLIMDEIENMC